MSRSAGPRIDRPAIPASYGVTGASEYVEWSHVAERLTRDKVYWIATVGAAGRPRVRPIDGMYLDGVLYVGGSPETRWVGELAANPSVTIHLDGLDDVIILEGEAEVMSGMGDELAESLAEASNAKFPEYGVTPPAAYKNGGAIGNSASKGRHLDRYHPEPDPLHLRPLTVRRLAH